MHSDPIGIDLHRVFPAVDGNFEGTIFANVNERPMTPTRRWYSMDIAIEKQVAVAQGYIAIVDDEKSVREALARLLRAERHRVETYTSGAEFLQSLEAYRPACVLLDLNMPGVTGYQVLQRLANLPTSIPVIVVTGDCSPHVVTRAETLGARTVLCKPVDATALVEAIDAVLHDRSLGKPA
jgi:FixJ family two-component response regulator